MIHIYFFWAVRGVIFLPSYWFQDKFQYKRKHKVNTEKIGIKGDASYENGRVLTLLKRIFGGGARLRRPSRERTRTTCEWMAQEMQ
jgi:hypothetical protein